MIPRTRTVFRDLGVGAFLCETWIIRIRPLAGLWALFYTRKGMCGLDWAGGIIGKQ